MRLEFYENEKLSKEHTKVWDDHHTVDKNFQLGHKVLLFNQRLKLFSGKLKCRWLGPYTITKVFPHGAVEIVDEEKGVPLKVNGQRLKLNYGGDVLCHLSTIPLSMT